MSTIQHIVLVKYEKKYAREVVVMWRASKERALGIDEIHSFDNHLDFFCNNLVKNNKVYLAIDQRSDLVAGFIAVEGAELNQLYIHIDYQRQGIGPQLLNLAKKDGWEPSVVYVRG